MIKKFCLLLFVCIFAFAGEFENVLQEAELFIERTYKTELARQSAIKKLQKIINDDKVTETEKIAKIRAEFLQSKLEEINEGNAYKLLYVRPLTWTVHSIAIAYDIENNQQILFSGKQLDTLDVSASRKNNGTSTVSKFIGASGKLAMNADAKLHFTINPFKLLSSKGNFSAEAEACFKGDISKNEQELWSRERQLALSEKYDTLSQVLSDTKISGCHLTFAVTFKNNLTKDLYFDSKSTVPVFANSELVLNAMPENINGSQEQTLPAKSTTTIKFRGAITNTKAQTLLRFMTSNSPTIVLEQGQIFIYSHDRMERNVAQASLSVPTIGISCRNIDWRIRKVWNNKHTTLKEALLAINSIYAAPVPFELNEKGCASIFKLPFGNAISSWDDLKPFALVEIDNKIYDSIPAPLLDSQIKNDLKIHIVDDFLQLINSPSTNDNVRQWLFAFVKKQAKNNYKAKAMLAYFYTEYIPYCPNDYSKSYSLFNEIAQDNTIEDKEIKEMANLMMAVLEIGGLGTQKNIPHALSTFVKISDSSKEPELQNWALLMTAILQIDESTNPDVTPESRKKGIEILLKVDYGSLADEELKVFYSLLMALYHMHIYDEEEPDYLKCIPFLTQAAKGNVIGISTGAKFMLSCFYYEGTGVDRDYQKAFALLKESSEEFDILRQNQVYNINDEMMKSYLSSLTMLGECYELGHGTSKDIQKANDYYKKAADFGDAEGQYKYAKALFAMSAQNKTDEDILLGKAIEYLKKAVQQGHPTAQATLAELILSEPTADEEHKKIAFSLLEDALKQNDLEAIVVYADCYLQGLGGEKDEKEAFKLYKQASEAGHSGATRMLGAFYLDGAGGVRQDVKLGVQYIIKAANNNDASAKFMYGTMLIEGDFGVKRNPALGKDLIKEAAKQGSREAIDYMEKNKDKF